LRRQWTKKSIEKDEIYSTDCIARLKKKELLSLYSNKNLAIASGATPIGSAGHAPNLIVSTSSYARVKIGFIIGGKTPDNKLAFYSHGE
jgi:hypothetical protein